MADVKKIATRDSYGNTLKELAAEGHDDLVVLDADLAAATKTGMFHPVSCRLIEQDQKLAVGQHQAGRFRAQTFLNILRGGGHGSGVLAKAFPALVEKLCGVVILEEQIHLVHEYPCVPSGQPICRHAVLDRLQHHIQRRGLELFTHLVEVKADDTVINIKIGFMGKHIQAALHEQLRCKGQFLCFTLRLPLDLVAPIRESRNPAFAAGLDEIVIDIGCP